MRSVGLLVGWDQRVEPLTISIARLRRISHSSRSSSDGTNVGRVVESDARSSGRNDAANPERAGSGSVGGSAPSRLTGGRSQFSHRNTQYLSLGTTVMLSSPDCMNFSSAPHEIQRIAPRAISQWQAHHTVARGSVGGRELGRPSENLSVFIGPIIIGTLVCARRWKIFDSGQPLRP